MLNIDTFYIIFILTILLTSFVRQFKLMYFTILSGFLVIFSFRSGPDEYQRYIDAVPQNFDEIWASIFSEPLYQTLSYIVRLFPGSKLTLYLITYSITFYLLYRSLCCISKTKKSFALATAFYFSHAFISFAYEGIRGGMANMIALYSTLIIINRRDNMHLLLLFAAPLVHIQTLPFSLISALVYFKHRIILLLNSFIVWLRPLFFFAVSSAAVIAFYFRDKAISFLPVSSSFLAEKYYSYTISEYHSYTIDTLSIQFVGALFVYLILVFAVKVYCKISSKPISDLIQIYTVGIIFFIMFSSLALLAFRVNSTFSLLSIPLICYIIDYKPSNRDTHALSFSIREILTIIMITSFTIYNVVIAGRLDEFSY